MRNLVLFLLGILFISSCKSDGTSLMKKVTGKPGETLVIITDDAWKGIAGDTIYHFMTQPQLGLPQAEPILDLVHIPPKAFKDIFKTNRNIILTKISSNVKENSIIIRRDVWAHPQVVISLQAKDEEAFVKLFTDNSDAIIGSFTKAEKERLMNAYAQTKFRNKAVYNTMLKKHNFELNIPKGFSINKDTLDFVWMRYPTPEISQELIAYWYPYTSDSTFTIDYLINKRDSILKLHVPGPTKGSYMATEKRVPITMNPFILKGNYTVELRGLWRVQGDFMGGPFISISTLDPIRQRVLTIEGSVYAPRYDKREYLRQLEAMLYSVAFPDQEKNDKINRMHQLGESPESTATN